MSQPTLIALMGLGMLAGSVWALSTMRGRALPLVSQAANIGISVVGILIGLVLLYRAATYEAPAGF